MNALLSNIKTVEFTPKILCHLYDSFVGSIISYACEVWGFSKSKELERIHMRFCRRVLGVKVSTRNAGINGELGRYPLYVAIYTTWFKIVYCVFHLTENSDIIVLCKVYSTSCQTLMSESLKFIHLYSQRLIVVE